MLVVREFLVVVFLGKFSPLVLAFLGSLVSGKFRIVGGVISAMRNIIARFKSVCELRGTCILAR